MTDAASQIDAVGWVRVSGGRLLAVRAQGKVAFYLPGGKREPGESDEQALIREVGEELSVKLLGSTLRLAGVFEAAADAHPAGTTVRLACYSAGFVGHLAASGEIAELMQFSAPISPGNSGGPVVDRTGAVVAVASAKFVGSGVEALSLGVPVQTVCAFVGGCT